MTLPSVQIVVLNWNRWSETLACLDSLSRLDYPNSRVIVVDNGSTDGSSDRIRTVWPDVSLIETGANLGYAGGNNVGIRAALKSGADFIWVLNNDTTIKPDSLTLQVEAFDRRPSAGIVVPKILFKKPAGIIYYAGGCYRERRGEVVHDGLDRRDTGKFDRERVVSFAPGTSLLTRRQVFQEVGLFDESYFMFWEDVDFTRRVHDAGWEILFVPDAVVLHTAGGSSDDPGRESALSDYYNTRNRLWYLRRHLRGPALLGAEAYTAPMVLRRVASIFLRQNRARTVKLKSLWAGLRDGFLKTPVSSVDKTAQPVQMSLPPLSDSRK